MNTNEQEVQRGAIVTGIRVSRTLKEIAKFNSLLQYCEGCGCQLQKVPG